MTTGAAIQVQSDVPARMRDGVVLRADLYRPAETGAYPVLLTRTPYGKTVNPLVVETAQTLAGRGFIVAVQDVRGRFASDGVHRVLHDDLRDGYGSVFWAAALPGSSGYVGMFGTSYPGYTQLWAAAQQPEPLRTIFPVMCGSSLYERWHDGGAFTLADTLIWQAGMAVEAAARLQIDVPELRRYGELSQERLAAFVAGDEEGVARSRDAVWQLAESWLRHLPLSTLPVIEGLAPEYFEWLAHPTYDAYWHGLDVRPSFPRWDFPCFSVGSWYDIDLQRTLDTFIALQTHSRTPQSRRAQKLLIGPWTHGQFVSQVGALDFGPEATIDLTSLQARWFGYWLQGIDTGLLDEPPVHLFVMGTNRWRAEADWPLVRTEYVPYYFRSGGNANTWHGDGELSPVPPSDESPDAFVYDPNEPVPTLGGKTLGSALPPGPFDQREVEERRDVLCYTTPPLERDLEVTGPLSVTLFAASSAPDTDWTAKLVDVHPDGAAYNLQEGIIRASHRVPGAAPSPIRPGEVYEYVIDLWATSNVFLAGHRIRVEISSSNFPHWDRNTNTGLPRATADRVVAAQQRNLHDAARPSHILLPIIPGD